MSNRKVQSKKSIITELKNLRQKSKKWKETENELEKQASFVAQNPAPVFQTRYDGGIVDTNPAATSIFGRDVKQRTIFSLFPNLKKSQLRKITRSKPFQIEHTIKDKFFLFTIKKDLNNKSFYVYGADITGSKLTEGELIKSHRFIKQVAHAAPSFIYVIDIINQQYLYVNEAYEKILGYKLKDFLGPKGYSFAISKIHPDDLKSVMNKQASILEKLEKNPRLQKQDKVYEFEYRVLDAKNNWHWIKSWGVVFETTENNKISQILGVANDISLQKESEEEHLKREKQFRQLVQEANDGIYRINLKGDIIFVNPIAPRILKYSKKELLNMRYIDLVRSDYKKEVKIHYNKQFEKKIPNTYNELPLVSKNGRDVWIGQNVQLVYDGDKIVGFQAVARDITERRKVEDLLIQSEERFRSLSEATFEGIGITRKGRVIDANMQLTEMLGYEIDELKDIDVMNIVAPESRDLVVKNIKEGYDKPYEHMAMKKDGTIFPVEVHGHTITYKGKSARVTAIHDLSMQKLAEQAIRESERKLKHAERMESLGILAGGVAHDLNNTLVPLLAITDLMLSELPRDSNLIEHANLIKRAAERAAETVGDLLTLARRGKYEMGSLNLNNLLNEFIDSSEYVDIQKQYPNVILELNCSEEPVNIKGSNSHLFQVIHNLIKNAYEAIEQDGKVKINTSKRYLASNLRVYEEIKAGDYVLLEIIDNGIGIARKDVNKIFEPFHTNKEMGKSGSGLGLSVVWGVVKDHDGYIDLDSTFGTGTKFSIYLPETLESETTTESKNFIDTHGEEKILVVDDLVDQQETLDQILSALGYSVICVGNGHDAVEHVKNNDVDLVVMDMILNDSFDGFDTYREIIKIKPNQKTILVSGFAKTERVKNAMLLGVGKFVQKPYTVDIIGRAVREELDKK